MMAVGGGVDSSGSLFTLVKGWLLAERDAKRRSHDSACEVTPTTATIVSAPAPAPSKPAPTAASKFDRFGGASRQGMYAM